MVPDIEHWNAASLLHASNVSPDFPFWSKQGQIPWSHWRFRGKCLVLPLHFPPCSTRISNIPPQIQWDPSLQSSLHLLPQQDDSIIGHSDRNLHTTCIYVSNSKKLLVVTQQYASDSMIYKAKSKTISATVLTFYCNVTWKYKSWLVKLSNKPWSVPRVWSEAGPEELAGWDAPVTRIQLKLAAGWGSRPQREPWKVHSLSGGQEPDSLLYTMMSSIAILPLVPPTTASIMNCKI